MQEPKYPHIHVKLSEEDGNAFSIADRVGKEILRHEGGAAKSEFLNDVLGKSTGSYDQLIRKVMTYVNVY